MTLAYLMAHMGISLAEAVALLESRGLCVLPNPGFHCQLAVYECELLRQSGLPPDTFGGAITVLPSLLVGGLDATYDWPRLRQQGVTHVATVAEEVRPFLPPSIKRLSIPLQDTEYANLVAFLPSLVDFVSSAWAVGGVVLIHSALGYSRCVAAVIGIAMVDQGCSMHDAMAHVREVLGHCEPNVQFLRQLEHADRTGSLGRMMASFLEPQQDVEMEAARLSEEALFAATATGRECDEHPSCLSDLMGSMSVAVAGEGRVTCRWQGVQDAELRFSELNMHDLSHVGSHDPL